MPDINLFENVSWEVFGPIPKVIGALILVAIILSVIIPKNSILKKFVGLALAVVTIVFFIIFSPKI